MYVNSTVYKNTTQGIRKFFSQVFSDRQKLIRKFVIFFGEAHFKLSGNVNNHSNRCWCSENPRNLYEVLHVCNVHQCQTFNYPTKTQIYNSQIQLKLQNISKCSNMFRITDDPSSGSLGQCLARITVMFLSRLFIWKWSLL